MKFRAHPRAADDRARDHAGNLTISGTVFWMLAAGRFGGSNLDAGDPITFMSSSVTIEEVYKEVKKSGQIWSGVRILKLSLILLDPE